MSHRTQDTDRDSSTVASGRAGGEGAESGGDADADPNAVPYESALNTFTCGICGGVTVPDDFASLETWRCRDCEAEHPRPPEATGGDRP